jgi:hypothetical protein
MADSTTTPTQPNTYEIRQDKWNIFLTEFTQENRGAHAQLEVLGPEFGYNVETEDRPFDGVSADIKAGERTVWFIFGTTPADHFTHGVHNATIIRALPPSGLRGAVLEVEAQDGAKTVLTLSWPEEYALPPADSEDENVLPPGDAGDRA